MVKALVVPVMISLLSGLPANAGANDAMTALVNQCFACHPKTPQAARLPALSGRSQTDLLQTLLDFKYQRRPATLMPRILKGLSDEELAGIAESLGQH